MRYCPSRGSGSVSPRHALLTQKTTSVYFYAGVSKESVYLMKQGLDQICESFAALQRKNPDVEMTPSPIYLHINSYGGGETSVSWAIN